MHMRGSGGFSEEHRSKHTYPGGQKTCQLLINHITIFYEWVKRLCLFYNNGGDILFIISFSRST
uniref:Uncharacterized protein n=1 Tax=Arundo donax TaxID=35708 RepID=A0A0A9HKZ9_ARUDO